MGTNEGMARERRSDFGSIRYLEKRARYRASYANPLKPGGIPRVERTFKYKADAAAWLAQEEAYTRDYWAGRHGFVPWQQRERERKEAVQAGSVTLRQYAERKYANYRKEDGSAPTESYLRKLREYLRHMSTADFWDKPLSSITPEEITAWKNNTDIAPTPRARTWREFKRIFQLAVDEGLIDRNPVAGRAPKVPKSKQAMIPPATAEELAAIYHAMRQPYRIAIYLAAIFDLRISEVCALQVRDVDFKTGVLHVRHGLGRGEGDRGTLRLKETKTASSTADQPIPEDFVPLLRKQMEGKRADSPLVPSDSSGEILNPNTLRVYFDDAKAGIRPDLHFHTLRKTAITAAAASGATLAEVMRYGRHSDVQTSVKRYQDAGGEQRQREIANAVATQLLPRKRTKETVEQEIAETEEKLTRLKTELETLSGSNPSSESPSHD